MADAAGSGTARRMGFAIPITANQGFYLLGLDNTSPTFASAYRTLFPPFTFLLAAILRQDRNCEAGQKRWNIQGGGNFACVCGATVITLYKGPTIYSPTGHPSLQKIPARLSLGDASGKNWTLGCVFLIGHCLSWASWLGVASPGSEEVPGPPLRHLLPVLFWVLQFLAIAAVFEREPEKWHINTGAELFSVFYAIWCIDRGGPVFVAVYQPVQTLVVAIVASVALGEEFYLGGIIGAVLIIIGLYFVLWGKNEEAKFAKAAATRVQSPAADHGPSSHIKSSLGQPLLQPTDDV
nr:protein WALLS ARE THIN 1-like [Ipomoea batatas]